jgi:uncharacterized protein
MRLSILKLLSIALFLLVFPFFLFSFAWANDFPQPVGHVNDFGEMLSDSFQQELETDLQNFEKETTAEVVVVTVETLGDTYLEDYAVELFEQWGIGKKEKDNGLLILIAEKEREIRIEVGYGLEPIITDARAGRIIREQMTPNFKKDDYDKGVKLAVEQAKGLIRSGEPPPETEKTQETSSSGFIWLVVGTIFLFYLSAFWARSKRIWPGGAVGGVLGTLLGLAGESSAIVLLLLFGFFGFFLDWLLSKNYKKRKKAKKPTSFFKSWGGFSSGSRSSGGGFGGFSGGSSGGGGASGGW